MLLTPPSDCKKAKILRISYESHNTYYVKVGWWDVIRLKFLAVYQGAVD
jgi:hypothetical protein